MALRGQVRMKAVGWMIASYAVKITSSRYDGASL